jgi:hypothetical protein
MKNTILVATIIAIVVELVAMFWGSTYSVPDLIRVDYGLPLIWGTNTLDTIAGPVNRWSVDVMFLVLDLIFWFATLIVVVPRLQVELSLSLPYAISLWLLPETRNTVQSGVELSIARTRRYLCHPSTGASTSSPL